MDVFELRNAVIADYSAYVRSFLTIRDVRWSTADCTLSRHAVMHGRSVAYDTLENSTKAFVVLLGLLEWATAHAACKG